MLTHRLAMRVALLAALSLPVAQAAAKTAHTMSLAEQCKRTLQEIQTSAAAVENEADQVKAMTARPGFSPESSLARLLTIKDAVNRMGRELKGLEAERASLPVWEQRAIDKTLPLLQLTAANTQGAIQYFNDNRSRLWTDTSRGYADRIYEESRQIATALHDYLRYDRLRDREQQLRHEVQAMGAQLGL